MLDGVEELAGLREAEFHIADGQHGRSGGGIGK
jgi:hypothetical protein